jgi:hypothetical protein
MEGGDGGVGSKTRQKGGGSVRALCHDACPCTCARPMPTHFCYAPCFVAGTDLEVVNSCSMVSRWEVSGEQTSVPSRAQQPWRN